MRIVRIDDKAERTVTHSECGAVIAFFNNEVQDGGWHEDYGGGRDKVWFITCPHCGKKIYVDKK
jgi:hypothetical protein